MKKIILPIIFILLFAISVSSWNEYNFSKPQCFQKSLYQINSVDGDSNFTFQGCDDFASTTNKYFSCDCKNDIKILYNKDVKITFRLQYYIEQPRIINNTNLTSPTEDEIYNQQIQRINTFTLDLKEPPKKLKNFFETFDMSNISFILIIIGVIILIVIVIIIFGIYVFLNSDELKVKIGKGVDDKMSLKEVLIAIFSRNNIQKNTKSTTQIKQVKEDKKDNIEDEVSKLLKDL